MFVQADVVAVAQPDRWRIGCVGAPAPDLHWHLGECCHLRQVLRDWDVVEPIISGYFPNGVLPVPMVVEVSRLTAKQGVRIEPDLWAALPAAR